MTQQNSNQVELSALQYFDGIGATSIEDVPIPQQGTNNTSRQSMVSSLNEETHIVEGCINGFME